MPSHKIKQLDELAYIVASLKNQGKKVVHCHGCFDLLHIGHIRYLGQARQMGDVLIVTITPDRYVDKGAHRPAFNEPLRAEAVASMHDVDYVAVNNWPTAEETLRLLRPDVYVKGSDFKDAASDPTGKLAREEKVVEEIGAELAFTSDVVFSSTNLINRFLSTFPEEIQEYISLFKSRYSLDQVLEYVERMASLKVMVVGDTILDDYHYCHTLGISSKDPTVAVKHDSSEMFAGGVLAVANNVANFTSMVHLSTVLGEQDSHESFIRSSLHSDINPFFMLQDGAPTLIKRRFLEGYHLIKLFEVYIMDDAGLSEEKDARFCSHISEMISDFDLVMVADFGHGTVSKNLRSLLSRQSPFLAVNTQANAGNRGFHAISNYGHADYVSLSEHEIRLEFRDMYGEIIPMLDSSSRHLGTRVYAVTQGKKGCLVKNQDDRSIKVPAFAPKVVDRVGSGDAFFSITALAACLDAPPEIIGFLGNVVGGLAVEILGNKKSIDPLNVNKYITSLLK